MKNHSEDQSIPVSEVNGDGAEIPVSPAEQDKDRALRSLLGLWRAPEASAALDGRVFSAYRAEIRSEHMKSESLSVATRPNTSSRFEGEKMKLCPTCEEEFADKFSFCPVDGTPLNELAAAIVASPPPVADNYEIHNVGLDRASSTAGQRPEYHLTIIEDAGLIGRLKDEIKEVAHQSELTWPEFKRDPKGFSGRMVRGYAAAGSRFLKGPNVVLAMTSAVFLVVAVILGIVLLDKWRARREQQIAKAQQVREELELTEMIPDNPEETPPDKGIGTGKDGRVGFNKGKGEGSAPKFKKASGGGGGGQEEQLPPQQGKLPPPSPIPAAIPTLPPTKPPMLPTAGIDLDPAFYKDLPFDRYGDPRSESKETSAGPGTGNGIGTGTGTGSGEGKDGGFGPGRDGNTGEGERSPGGGGPGGAPGSKRSDYTKTFKVNEVTQKARITSKPEPQYTEEARKNQVTGTVVLKAVLSSSGQVTSIKPISTLPFGLTEKTIAAAMQIKFTPAIKDGHPVSQWIQIEYNFNLY
jgi:TonB family protein